MMIVNRILLLELAKDLEVLIAESREQLEGQIDMSEHRTPLL